MVRKVPLLDLGNVILHYDFNPFFTWIQKNSDTKDIEVIRRLLTSSLFYEYEFGNIERAGFIKRLENLFKGSFPPVDFQENFCNIFLGPVEGMEAAIETLLEQGPVYCLSNTNEMHLDYVRNTYPLHKRKPYPGIYRDVSHALDLAPQSLVFFDDIEANVQGARRAGLEAHIFNDANHLVKIATEAQHKQENP